MTRGDLVRDWLARYWLDVLLGLVAIAAYPLGRSSGGAESVAAAPHPAPIVASASGPALIAPAALSFPGLPAPPKPRRRRSPAPPVAAPTAPTTVTPAPPPAQPVTPAPRPATPRPARPAPVVVVPAD